MRLISNQIGKEEIERILKMSVDLQRKDGKKDKLCINIIAQEKNNNSHKKIAKIQYNTLNLPSALQFTQGHTTEYLYDAAGVKRRVKQITAVPDMFVSMGTIRPVSNDSIKEITLTDYCGNVIYENGVLSRILVDGGYITMSGTTPTYHYYIVSIR